MDKTSPVSISATWNKYVPDWSSNIVWSSFDDIVGPRKRALEKIVDKMTSSDSSDDKE